MRGFLWLFLDVSVDWIVEYWHVMWTLMVHYDDTGSRKKVPLYDMVPTKLQRPVQSFSYAFLSHHLLYVEQRRYPDGWKKSAKGYSNK